MIPPLLPGTLEKAASGHRADAEALVNFIYAYAYAISRAGFSDVKDLTHDVFIKVLTAVRAGRFETQKDESAWVVTIVRNAFLDTQRASIRHRARFEMDHDAGEVPDDLDIEGDLHRRKQCKAVENALDKLDADDRTLLVLKFVMERSNADIAEALGTRENTVKSRVHRLTEKLKYMVGGHRAGMSRILAFRLRRAMK